MGTAERVVSQFQRMVERDGGRIELLDEHDGVVRVRYVVGVNEECAACVLEPDDLAELMSEALEAQGGSGRVHVVTAQ